MELPFRVHIACDSDKGLALAREVGSGIIGLLPLRCSLAVGSRDAARWTDTVRLDETFHAEDEASIALALDMAAKTSEPHKVPVVFNDTGHHVKSVPKDFLGGYVAVGGALRPEEAWDVVVVIRDSGDTDVAFSQQGNYGKAAMRDTFCTSLSAVVSNVQEQDMEALLGTTSVTAAGVATPPPLTSTSPSAASPSRPVSFKVHSSTAPRAWTVDASMTHEQLLEERARCRAYLEALDAELLTGKYAGAVAVSKLLGHNGFDKCIASMPRLLPACQSGGLPLYVEVDWCEKGSLARVPIHGDPKNKLPLSLAGREGELLPDMLVSFAQNLQAMPVNRIVQCFGSSVDGDGDDDDVLDVGLDAHDTFENREKLEELD